MASKNIKCPHCNTVFKVPPVKKSNTTLQAEKTKAQNKALQSLKFWEDKTTYLSRIEALKQKEEYGYAFLNLWNRIETAAKLCYYFDKNTFSDSLNYNWRIWNDIKVENQELFDNILSTAQGKESLQNNRNLIVHQTKTLDKSTYEKYCQQAEQFLQYTTTMLEEKYKTKLDNLKMVSSK